MRSWVKAILGWILGFFIDQRKQAEYEKKYADAEERAAKHEADAAGLRKRLENEEEKQRDKDEWENATDEEKVSRILRRFNKR